MIYYHRSSVVTHYACKMNKRILQCLVENSPTVAIFFLFVDFSCWLSSLFFLSFQATVLCDVVVLYVLQKKYFYREKKYLFVDDSDRESDSYQVILIFLSCSLIKS